MASGVSASREARALSTAFALAVLGLLVLKIGFAPFDQRAGWLTILGGWIVAGSGLLAWLRLPSERAGILLVLAGATPLLGVLVDGLLRIPGLAELGASAGWAFLGNAVVTARATNAGERWLPITVLALYATLAVPIGVAGPLRAGIVMAALARRILGGARPTRSVLTVGAILAVGTTNVLTMVGPAAGRDARIESVVVEATIGLILAAGLVVEASRHQRILDLVADLDDPDRVHGITRRLQLLLDEPDLEIGYFRPADGMFIDTDGREIATDPPGRAGATRQTTTLFHQDQPVARLRHRPGALVDAAVRQCLSRAAWLVVAQRRLRVDVADQLVQVGRSRRRLVEAADEENLQLRRELEERVGPRLDALDAALQSTTDPSVPALVASASGHVVAARRDIAAILDGLPPADLMHAGVGPALEALAARSPLKVRTRIDADGPDDPAVCATIYYTCSEGLANAIRHAGAATVTVAFVCGRHDCLIEVADDGVGGAAIGADGGTGLLGIRDRVEAVGGRLDVHSPPGEGTRLVARVPIRVSAGTAA